MPCTEVCALAAAGREAVGVESRLQVQGDGATDGEGLYIISVFFLGRQGGGGTEM